MKFIHINIYLNRVEVLCIVFAVFFNVQPNVCPATNGTCERQKGLLDFVYDLLFIHFFLLLRHDLRWNMRLWFFLTIKIILIIIIVSTTALQSKYNV